LKKIVSRLGRCAYTARRASLRVRSTRRIWGFCGSGSRTGKLEAGGRAEEVTPKRPCSSYLHGGSSTRQKICMTYLYQLQIIFPFATTEKAFLTQYYR